MKSFENVVTGIHRFQTEAYPQQRALFEALAKKQEPKVLFITCSDSRIDPNLITQTDPGDLFVARNIGNLVAPYGSGEGSSASLVEYAVGVLKVEHVVVCGHSGCGAMKSLLDLTDDTLVPQVTAWLRYAESARRVANALHEKDAGLDLLRTAAEQNVLAQLRNLRTYPEVSTQLAANALTLHGWYYDIGSGQVSAFSTAHSRFVPVAEVASGTQSGVSAW
jgi:carbonic anhydrase